LPTAREVGDAYRKLERAQHHINDLSRRVDAFLAEKPFKLTVRHRRKASKMEFFVKTEKPIPPEFSLIIGDAVHNLRASLDLILYAFAYERAPSPDKLQFPFPRGDTDNALEGAISSGQVKFAGEKVADAVRALNPRPTGDRILSGIHTLDVRDKHRLLILSRQVADMTTGVLNELTTKHSNITFAGPGIFRWTGPDNEPILKVGREYILKALPDTQEEAKVQPVFGISFGDPPFANEPAIRTLVSAATQVRSALDKLVIAYLDPANQPAPTKPKGHRILILISALFLTVHLHTRQTPYSGEPIDAYGVDMLNLRNNYTFVKYISANPFLMTTGRSFAGI
jgi:hypothetical protein